MNKSFGDQLVELWEEHRKRGEADPEWHTLEPVFRLRLKEAAERMFGDLAPLLSWTVYTQFGKLRARAEIPGYAARLEWSADITGLYAFRAWAGSAGEGTWYLIDGRLKLGAVLWEEDV
jgi:hypothetical protein